MIDLEWMDIVKDDAFWGLIGAVIGGGLSIGASMMQIKAQQKTLEAQQREQKNKTMVVIMRFIKKEVVENYEVLNDVLDDFGFSLEFIDQFTYKEFSAAFQSHYIKERFVFKSDHYNKFKYEIAYMEHKYANEIIDYYELFEFISSVDFRDWTEEGFNFYKKTLKDLKFFIVADYDHWGMF